MSKIKLIIADMSSAFTANIISHISISKNIEIAGICKSGIELQKMVADKNPDAVLMDIILEETDGLTSLKMLKSRYPDISYIVCTEFCNDTIISRAVKSGASAFICKPADRNAVIETICETVSLERSSRIIPDNSTSIPENVVARILAEVGISGSCEGYRLLRHSVLYALKSESATLSMTKQLYPELARIFGTTSSRAERNIRTAIDSAFSRGCIKAFSKKPTNREFILYIAKLALASNTMI